MPTVLAQLLFRRGTGGEWGTANTVLANGEPGWSYDQQVLKIGDGHTPWADLKPLSLDPAVLDEINAAADRAEAAADRAEEVGSTNDAIVSGLVYNPTSQTTTALRTVYESKYVLTFKASDPHYKGANDGATLTTVLAAANSASGLGRVRVDLDGANWNSNVTLSLPTHTTLSNGTITYTGTATTGGLIVSANNATNWGLDQVSLDCGTADSQDASGVLIPGTATLAQAITVSATATSGRIRGGTIRGGKNWAIYVASGAQDIRINDVTFSDLKGGIFVYESASNIWVTNSDFTRWHGIAIYSSGTTTAAPSKVNFSNNTFHDPSRYSSAGNGFVARQSIAFQTDSTRPFKGVTVQDNKAYGPAVAFSDAIVGGAGTGDQFSFWYVQDFTITGNHSYDGGENGFSLVKGSRDGTFSNNIAARNDGHGVQIGSLGFPVYNVTATGNTAYNNGQDRANETPETIAGFFAQDTFNLTLTGNSSFDDQAVPTQDYGYSLTNAVDTVYQGNRGHGNTTAGLLDSGTTSYKKFDDTNAATLGDGTASVIWRINGAVATRREIRWQTAGSDRVRMYVGAAPETGVNSNTGSSFFLDTLLDNGTTATNRLRVDRSGLTTIPGDLTVGGTLSSAGLALSGIPFGFAEKGGAAQTWNNDTGLATITGLSATVVANAYHEVIFTIIYDSSITADLKFHPVFSSSGHTFSWYILGPSTGVGAANGVGTSVWLAGDATTASIPVGGSNVGVAVVAKVVVRIKTGVNAGTVTLQAAQNTADPTVSTVQTTSTVEAVRKL